MRLEIVDPIHHVTHTTPKIHHTGHTKGIHGVAKDIEILSSIEKLLCNNTCGYLQNMNK